MKYKKDFCKLIMNNINIIQGSYTEMFLYLNTFDMILSIDDLWQNDNKIAIEGVVLEDKY